MNVIYLHGFASSPNSKKAAMLKSRFAERGINLRVPDLNVPSFDQLTMTDMLKRVHQEVVSMPPGEITLIGSSLGGMTAVNYADKHHYGAIPEGGKRVSRLVLLAPAFDAVENWRRRLGDDGMAQWKRDGYMNVHNYAIGGEARVHYGFIQDLRQYDPYGAEVDMPILIFQGLRDDTVPYIQSQAFAENRVHTDLRLVDSDHELLDQVDVIWVALESFLNG